MRMIYVALACFLLGACVSKGPLRNNPGALYEFSDDQPTVIPIDINRILFNQVCLNSEGTPVPEECGRIEGGIGLGFLARREDGGDQTTQAPGFNTRNTDGVQVFSNLLLALEKLDKDKQRHVRNAAAYQMLAASEHGCRNYLFTIRGVQTNTRFGTDVWSGLFASASSLTNAADPSNLYSALSGFGILTAASVDRSFFANQAIEPVRVAIDSRRDGLRTGIETRLTSPYADYPFGVAMADLIRYHSACSLMEGLSDVSQAVNSRETAIKTARLVAQRLTTTSATGEQIVAALTGVEEARLGLEPDKTAAAPKPKADPASDIAAANAAAVKKIMASPVDGPAAFDAAKARSEQICTNAANTMPCIAAQRLNTTADWWTKAKAALPSAADKTDEKAAYQAAFQKLLQSRLKELSEPDSLKRTMAIALLEELEKSTTLTRKQAREQDALGLMQATTLSDPVLSLIQKAFSMADDKSDSALAAPSARLGLSFVKAYLADFQ